MNYGHLGNCLANLWIHGPLGLGYRAGARLTYPARHTPLSPNTLHTKMRLNASCLNCHRFTIGLIPAPTCPCGHNKEDNDHYVLHCPLYVEDRGRLFRTLTTILGYDFTNLSTPDQIHLLLQGPRGNGNSSKDVWDLDFYMFMRCACARCSVPSCGPQIDQTSTGFRDRPIAANVACVQRACAECLTETYMYIGEEMLNGLARMLQDKYMLRTGGWLCRGN